MGQEAVTDASALTPPLAPVAPDPHGGERLARSGIAVTLISLLGLMASTVTQLLIAWYFGSGGDADAFVVGTTLPLYAQAVMIGALGPVIMPALSRVNVAHGHAAAIRLAVRISLILTLAIGGVSLLGAVFAAPIIHLTTPGLSATSAATAVTIARLLWPTVWAMSLTTLFTSVLQLEGRFIWPAILPVVGSLLNALIVAVGARMIGIGAAGIGSLAAALIQVGLLVWLCWPRDRSASAPVAWNEAVVMIAALVPLILSGLLVRSTPVVDRYFGSEFPQGTIARLGYAFRIVTVAPGLFTVGIGTVLFPRMSLSVARSRFDDLRRTLGRGLSIMLSVCAPTILFGMLLAPDTVRILLERGKFTVADTAAVTEAIRIYLPSLFAFVLCVITGRAIYALNAVRVIAFMGAAESAIYVLYTFAFVRLLGWQGIALGYTVYTLGSLVWQTVYLRVRLGAVIGPDLTRLLARTAVALAVSGTIVWGVTLTPLSAWLHLIMGALGGASTYLAVLMVLRSPELRTVVGLLPRFSNRRLNMAARV